MKDNVVILENNVNKIRQNLRQETLKRAVLAGGEVIRNEAKINIRKTFSKRSRGGAGLAGSMYVELVKSDDSSAWVDVGPTKVYGRIQELGGVIRPVIAKMLSWIDPDTGIRIFAKKVVIPPRPYLRPAVDTRKNEIQQAVGEQIRIGIERSCS